MVSAFWWCLLFVLFPNWSVLRFVSLHFELCGLVVCYFGVVWLFGFDIRWCFLCFDGLLEFLVSGLFGIWWIVFGPALCLNLKLTGFVFIVILWFGVSIVSGWV